MEGNPAPRRKLGERARTRGPRPLCECECEWNRQKQDACSQQGQTPNRHTRGHPGAGFAEAPQCATSPQPSSIITAATCELYGQSTSLSVTLLSLLLPRTSVQLSPISVISPSTPAPSHADNGNFVATCNPVSPNRSDPARGLLMISRVSPYVCSLVTG